ncbi:TetR/AcrR family transcriptional regulator [Microlunatus speluncae]|uniref:TetR/AcrR family transcriptional regulator n=1 Tax=Microlunatus speluncae TaxID=2594267 RepID=UPI0012668664|nr:TetR/AcrR family transcriptional regulator [Microlunatus speluncae]
MVVKRGILSVAAIVEQGITLADAEGLDAVSMRAIADRLGTGVMSLYRHVPNKEHLVELMVEAVSERYAYPDHTGNTWRQSLTVLAETDWAMYLEHPWTLVASLTSRPPIGPSTLRAMEWAYSAIAELGLPPKEATSVIMAVTTHVQGVAQLAVSERRLAESSDIDAVEWWRRRIHELDGGDHPHLEPIAQGFIEGDVEQWMIFDLTLILDGIEQLARRHRRGRATGRG